MVLHKELLIFESLKPLLEHDILHSYRQHLLRFVQDGGTLLCVLFSQHLKLFDFGVESHDRGSFCPIGELLAKRGQFVELLDKLFVHLHSLGQLFPNNFVFEHDLLTVFNCNQFEEELLQMGFVFLVKDFIQSIYTLKMIERYAIQKVGVVYLAEYLRELVANRLKQHNILLVEFLFVCLLHQRHDAKICAIVLSLECLSHICQRPHITLWILSIHSHQELLWGIDHLIEQE